MAGVRDVKGATVRILADNAIVGPTINEQVATSFGVPTTPSTFVVTYATGLSFTTTSMGSLITYATSVTTTTVLTSKMPTGVGTVSCSIITRVTTNDTITVTPSWTTATGIIKGIVSTSPNFVTSGTATATSTITTTSAPTITVGIAVTPTTGSISGTTQSYACTVPADFWGGTASAAGHQTILTIPFEIFANTAAPGAVISMYVTNNCSQTVAIYNNTPITVTVTVF